MSNISTEQKLAVMEITIRKMSEFLRKYPPDLEAFYEEKIPLDILCGGSERDPEGKEWTRYWLHRGHETYLNLQK